MSEEPQWLKDMVDETIFPKALGVKKEEMETSPLYHDREVRSSVPSRPASDGYRNRAMSARDARDAAKPSRNSSSGRKKKDETR